jgi:hypothetical protein
MAMVEDREFKADPNLVLSVIRDQAGTVSKAILEAVMNSVDSDSRKCEVTFTPTGFEIIDNGKGFKTAQEIDQYFQTFGTPHVAGDAEFGRFRVGRGQLMSYGVNVWRSGKFEMHTDVNKDGLKWKLHKLDKSVKGCHIKVTLYRPLEDDEFGAELEDLKQMVAYVRIPLFINGEKASTPPSSVKWDREDDDAYYRTANDGSNVLTVYNLGVKVCAYPKSRLGTSGIIVSKKQLQLNMARNDIKMSDCKVWERIASGLKLAAITRAKKQKSLGDDERRFIASQIGYSTKLENDESLLNMKLITGMDGRVVTIKAFLSAPVIAFADYGEEKVGEAVHRAGRAFVIRYDQMRVFSEYSLESLVELLEIRTGFKGERVIEKLRVLGRGVDTKHHAIEDGNLPAAEQHVLELLREYNDEFVAIFRVNSGLSDIKPRNINAGRCDAALAWTDGEQYIRMTRKVLAAPAKLGLPGMMYALQILAHEYTHDNDDYETHEHEKVFYNKYHDVSLYDAIALTRLGMKMSAALTKRLGQEKKAAKAQKPHEVPKLRAAAAPREVAAVAVVAVDEQHREFASRQMSLFGN